MNKKILSLLLTLTCCLSLIPAVQAFGWQTEIPEDIAEIIRQMDPQGGNWTIQIDSNGERITISSSDSPVPVTPDKPSGSLSNFKKSNTYHSGMFTDVSDKDWFAKNVKAVYEYGLMNGSGGKFNPKNNITRAQTLAIACRLHSIYTTGTADFAQGNPWYKIYCTYAMSNGIDGMFDLDKDLTTAATRRDVAQLLYWGMGDLLAKNSVASDGIPDVPQSDPGHLAIITLYRGGVAGGRASDHAFLPDNLISRAEVAAMAARLADPSLRLDLDIQGPASASDSNASQNGNSTNNTPNNAPFTPVPMKDLANRKSLQKKATNDQLAQAYAEAVKLVTPYAGLRLEEQLQGVAKSLRYMFDNGMDYSMTSSHYNDPYGYFIEKSASCAGCTRATGLCLNILGIPYEHVNENKYTHQWCRVNVNGTYWICDAYGLYCGPEPSPYTHPYFQ